VISKGMVEAAGVAPEGEGAKRRRPTPNTDADRPSVSEGYGGGGIRTRVRKHVLVGLYMRIRFCFLVPGVRKRLKTAGHQTRFISRSRAGPPRDRQPV
jgi:hypothetical protein